MVKQRKKKSNGKILPQNEESPAPIRRKPRWYHVVIPFLIVLFGFGGLDAILLRDLFAFFNAIFLVGIIHWRSFYSVKSRVLERRITAAAALAYFLVILFLIPPPKISRDTTYLLQPRTENGREIDYFRAIEERIGFPKNPRENGFRCCVEALGPEILERSLHIPTENRASYWRKLCESLDLEPGKKANLTFQGAEFRFFQILKEQSEGKNPDSGEKEKDPVQVDLSNHTARTLMNRLLEKPWSEREFPIAGEWLLQNEPFLELLYEALEGDDFAVPMIRLDENQSLRDLPDISFSLLEPAKGLRLKILSELSRGNTEKAWILVEKLFRLSRFLFECAPDFNGTIVAKAIWNEGFRGAVAVLHYGDNTEEELNRYRERFQKYLDPFHRELLQRLMLFDRFSTLDRLQALAVGRTGWKGIFPEETEDVSSGEGKEYPWFFRRLLRLFHWNETLARVNGYFDWLESQDSPDLFPRTIPLNITKSEFENIMNIGIFRAVPDKLGVREIQIRIDSNRSREQSIREVRTNAALLESAFYLELFRKRNGGKYPQTWTELREKSPGKIPGDPCNLDEPFVYQALFQQQGYLMYSIGSNGKDDGGASWSDQKGRDDISVRKDPWEPAAISPLQNDKPVR